MSHLSDHVMWNSRTQGLISDTDSHSSAEKKNPVRSLSSSVPNVSVGIDFLGLERWRLSPKKEEDKKILHMEQHEK